MPLPPEKVSAYFDQGYLVLPDFFPAALIETLVAEVERSMADPAVFNANRAHFSFAADERAGKHYVLQALHSENLSRTLSALVKSPQVLEAAASILGPDIDLFQAKLVFKKADGGAEVPWHQDFDYWKRLSKAPLQLNFGIYLDDTTRENGCLEVVPQSHAAGLQSHRNRKDRLNFPIQWDQGPEAGKVIPIEARKGTVILFSALTAHHSQANLSPRRRLFLNLVFSAAGNDHIPTLALARKPAAFEVAKEMDPDRIPGIWGPGPHGGQCAPQYRIKELWKQAITGWDPALADWVYVHANQAADSAPEWFAARRRPEANFIHLRTGGEAYPDSQAVHFLRGDVTEAILGGRLQAALRGDIGLLILQSQDYGTVKRLLDHLGQRLKPGSILVFEGLFGWRGWEHGAAYALIEFARQERAGLLLLGKTETGLVAKLESKGSAYGIKYAAQPWISNTQGIATGFGTPPPEKAMGGKGPLMRIKRVLRSLREDSFPSPHYRDFFPAKRIPQFKDGNVPGPCCGTHLRRKELWKYALSFIADPKLPWCEFGVGEGESLDWFALNKPEENLLFGFDSFEGIPEAWTSSPKGQWKTSVYAPNRDDVRIVKGLYQDSLTRPAVVETLGPRVGFVHIDCDLYNSTRLVFQSLGNRIGPGTVIVFDEMYGYSGWQKHEARAFFEFAAARNLEFEYLARSDMQVALRIVAIGTHWSRSVREMRFRESGNGIRLDHGEDLFLGYSLSKLFGHAKTLRKRVKQGLIRP
ncbi:MAG TPA: phytanoyl-CoA dioxygenase family protein [Fibrobacteria bacterium]|nr:phytanoyl-CoA dioxygenase family protein [Fibrobacteria bacterium]